MSGAAATRAGRGALGVALSAALLLAVVALALAFGTEPISVGRALGDPTSFDHRALFEVRLPRVLLGAVSGAGLAVVGVALQSVLRNPLAEPYMLGVSGGSALGATLAILAGIPALTVVGRSMFPLVPLCALGGGLAATALVYGFARASGGGGTQLLLAGVVVNAIAAALITFLKTLVSASKAQELLFWLMGSLDAWEMYAPERLAAVTAYVALGVAVLFVDAARLNVLALGEEPALHLGVSVRALERRTLLACSLVVGAITSVTGLIGFVGLIVPHALRRVLGPDARVLVPASVFAGAAVLVACDLVSRASFRWLHTEPPVGAVTALVGGPLFLVVLRKRRGD